MTILKDSELRYRRLFEAAQDGILILEAGTGMIEDVNPYLIKMLGYSREEFIKKKLWEVGAFRDIEASRDAFEALQKDEYIRYDNMPLKAKDGRLIQVEFVSNVYLVGSKKVIQCNIRDITAHKRAEKALQTSEARFKTIFDQAPLGIALVGSLTGQIYEVNPRFAEIAGRSVDEMTNTDWMQITHPDDLQADLGNMVLLNAGKISGFQTKKRILHPDGTAVWVNMTIAPLKVEDKAHPRHLCMIEDITNHKRTEDALRASEERFRALIENSADAISLLTSEGVILYESPAVRRILGYQPDEMVGHNAFEFLHPDDYAASQELFEKLFQPAQTPVSIELRYKRKDDTWSWMHATGTNLLAEPSVKAFVVNYHDITERKQADERIRRQVAHLTALSSIDRVIASNFDLELSLTTLLVHVIAQLHVDAAAVLLFKPDSLKLEYAVTQGFRTKNIEHLQLPLLDGYGGRVVLDRQMVNIPNINELQEKVRLTTLLADDEFLCYYGVPLISMGQVKGVLEVFHRTALEPDAEWFTFLNSLAGQGAIAIENVTLFENLQHSNLELKMAYDTTIVGWSRALDLRDKETEGHTQRVTELTVKLARAFGFREAELVQIRWGALLHDIGKMGVPDEILLKAGPLTDEEWVTMKKHPSFAYELLAPIRFLHLALDIPYCHHERWDGTGYPRGLKGDEIPLVARIFAVLDVWDALNSDRPYRPAWSKENARDHIRAASGTHFDPQVVNVFLQTLN